MGITDYCAVGRRFGSCTTHQYPYPAVPYPFLKTLIYIAFITPRIVDSCYPLLYMPTYGVVNNVVTDKRGRQHETGNSQRIKGNH